MLLFIDFCAVPWLGWLLPLLGLLLGWLLWGRLSGRVSELEETNGRLQSRIKSLEGDLNECTTGKAGLQSEISLLEGRMREQSRRMQFLAEANEAKQTSAIEEPVNAETKVVQEEVPDPPVSDVVEADQIEVDYEQVEAPVEETPEVQNEAEEPKEVAAIVPPVVTTPQGLASEGPIAPRKTHPESGTKKNIYAGLKPDNLQVVEGIGPKMNEILNNAGIDNWSDLGAKSTEDIRAILDSVNAKRYRIIDPSSWPEQARLAASGDFETLIKLQKNLSSGRSAGATGETDSKVEKLLIKMGVIKRWKQNDLTAVEGIGPKISGLLQADGITTWRELANAKVERIQAVLDAAGKRYKLADPSSWPKQAEMAADGRWDDLDEYQDFLNGGK